MVSLCDGSEFWPIQRAIANKKVVPVPTRLVFHHVGLKHISKLVPLPPIENTIAFEAFGGSISHVKSMVRVVVDEQSLSTESKESLDFLQPVINGFEVGLISDWVNGISLRKPTCEGVPDRSGDRNAGLAEPSAEQFP